ncbi:MAG TPA: ABC transporter ATP-binding protein [bacterium]|nr:ABC transporter ATP-binding protein [bacterium]
MENVISLKNITKSYGDKVKTEVLHGIDLDISEGDFCALVGQSGSGKTTLLNIMGLLDRPTSGTVSVFGRQLEKSDNDELTAIRGRTIGFVFQFHHLIGAFNSLENVMLPMMAASGGLATKAMREKAKYLLDSVGMSDRLTYKPDEISGGQRQRVSIARALAMDPKVILADEPTGNLDTAMSNEVFSLLRKINLEQKTSFLIVTHDSTVAASCDRTVKIVDGRLI